MGDDGCCAFALSGQAAAAPPKTPMNSRRRIHSPCKGKRRSPISTLSWQARVRPVPLWVDCVEKVLPSVGTDFMRAAGAFGVLGRGDASTGADSISRLPTCSERASPAEVGDQLAFAQIFLTRHFRLFQHNRPTADFIRSYRHLRRPRVGWSAQVFSPFSY
jgi:hypothetical protein